MQISKRVVIQTHTASAARASAIRASAARVSAIKASAVRASAVTTTASTASAVRAAAHYVSAHEGRASGVTDVHVCVRGWARRRMKPIKPIKYLIFQSHNYKFTFSDI